MPEDSAVNQVANSAVEHLRPFIGTWAVSIAEKGIAAGTITFEWLEGQAFVLQRSAPPDPMPGNVAVIGCDDSTGQCSMQYFDERGVARIYQWSLNDGVWMQWREASGFSQRFTGTFSADGDTIHGTWELCRDGTTWEKDFDLIYRRVAANS